MIHIGIIGLGRRGSLAMHAHKPDAGVRVVAGVAPHADYFETHRHRYAKTPELAILPDHRALLARDDIDAVFVTSPDYLHEAHAIDALEAGKHVYLEKPMAITTAGCDRILAAACRTGKKVYVGHNMRHMDFVLKMKELVDGGAIGDVRTAWCRHFVSYGGDAYFKDWHAERAKATSLLLQKASHDIDVLHWICGGYTRRATAMGNLTVYNRVAARHPAGDYGDADWSNENWPPMAQTGLNPVIDVEDLSLMLMELDNGVLCSYEQCHYAPDGWRNYTIIGTEGRIENFGDSPGDCTIRLWNKRVHYKPDGDAQFVIPPVEGGHGGADPRIVDEFIRYLRDEAPISVSPLAARNSVAAGCAAAQSLRNGSIPVEVPAIEAAIRAHFDL